MSIFTFFGGKFLGPFPEGSAWFLRSFFGVFSRPAGAGKNNPSVISFPGGDLPENSHRPGVYFYNNFVIFFTPVFWCGKFAAWQGQRFFYLNNKRRRPGARVILSAFYFFRTVRTHTRASPRGGGGAPIPGRRVSRKFFLSNRQMLIESPNIFWQPLPFLPEQPRF